MTGWKTDWLINRVTNISLTDWLITTCIESSKSAPNFNFFCWRQCLRPQRLWHLYLADWKALDPGHTQAFHTPSFVSPKGRPSVSYNWVKSRKIAGFEAWSRCPQCSTCCCLLEACLLTPWVHPCCLFSKTRSDCQHSFAKTQNPKQVSLNPKAQLPQITSPANLLLDTRTRTNQEGWQSFSL